MAVDLEQPQPQPHQLSLLKRSTSIWRRLSQRGRSKSPPSAEHSPTPSRQRLQRRTTSNTRRRMEKPTMITHLHRIDIELPRPPPTPPSPPIVLDPQAQPPSSPTPRVHPSSMSTTTFPSSSRIHTVSWDIFLTPPQIYRLFTGFHPRQMEDKWFIYSEGPDLSGKLKVHFHRSWTGMKIAELFVVVDLRGEGAGKIVGIKWNGSEQTNGMDEEEAKYMISTTCAWVLGVNMDNGQGGFTLI